MKGAELKPRVGLFGRRNVGKSSMINYLTGQQIAIVSNTPGTTTDPVRCTMEVAGVGPVVLVDTAGIDDEGELGQQRVEKSMQALAECDLVLLLHWGDVVGEPEERVRQACRQAGVPWIEVDTRHYLDQQPPDGRDELLARLRAALPTSAYTKPPLLSDVVRAGDTVVLVTPIDGAAPEGRMILPQVQVLRELMDLHARALFCQPSELHSTLDALRQPPQLVITDSQAFAEANTTVPDTVPLTSFSIVLARQKGMFDQYLLGTPTIGILREGDRVLLLESCTHNVTCEDIGRVKLPAALQRRTGVRLQCDICGGDEQPARPLNEYRLVVQCGGCVITPRQVRARLQQALQAGVPVSNYGLALAWCSGIFDRATKIFRQ